MTNANLESVRRMPRNACTGIHHKHKIGEREHVEMRRRIYAIRMPGV